MNKKTILIGGGILAVLGILWYMNWKKKNTAYIQQTIAEQQEQQEADAERKKDLESGLVEEVKSTYIFDDSAKSRSVTRLVNTLNSGIMSLAEVQMIRDLVDLQNNNYVGTKSDSQIQQDAKSVYDKYGLARN